MPQEIGAGAADRILSLVQAILREDAAARPLVTVTWAQTAAGAIAAVGGARAAISGPESMTLTHRLRALHDAILVGIQTVLSDDPLLSVRLVEGPQPQPVVLDSRLRFPLGARLLARDDRKTWIFHSAADPARERELEKRGARLFRIKGSSEGLDLVEMLHALADQGIQSLMVEGGARVLAAFMKQGLARQAVVTISPSQMDGVPGPGIPALLSPARETLGPDTVLWGRLEV